MKFTRKNLLLHKLILVDGVGRSGKVMLAEILTGFQRVEKQDYNEFFEYIPLAYKYNKISKDIAISILRTQMDTELYKSMIGRSINTRPSDYTSLYKYHSPEKYLKRQIDEDGPIIASKVLNEKPIYLNWCHDMIQKSDIIFEAFNDKVTLIYINRHPVDIIYEWNLKKFGERVANDSTEMQYLIEFNENVVPELALGWEEEYININSFERVVKMIYISFKRNLEAIEKLNTKNNIKIVDFEDLVTKTDKSIEDISQYLNLKPLNIMNNILQKENCPRVLDDKDRAVRKKNIVNKISEKYIIYLDEIIEMYKKISLYK